MTTATLCRLSEAEPPLPNRVIKVSREEPIAAQLSDGSAVLVTWIGENAAICVTTADPADVYHTDKLALKNKALILVDPEKLPWVKEVGVRHQMRGKRFGSGQRQRVHRCAGCGRTGGTTRFATPHDDYCIECEEAGRA